MNRNRTFSHYNVLNIVQLSSLLILSTSTATTSGTTGSGGLSTDDKIKIGLGVGGALLGAFVMILAATGIFKCWKRCFDGDLEDNHSYTVSVCM